uniref:Palmitoyltransferase n=1 Tax=Catagonus wagneri TaxID=51154 RepID=A0A8C3YH27_9CETA
MGQPWAVWSAEGPPAQLPLVLTALWAAAVGLGLAYMLVLGPEPTPLGPLMLERVYKDPLVRARGTRLEPEARGIIHSLINIEHPLCASYCNRCQSQVPPHSGHCSTCSICILRGEHQCRLLGRCVGFYNYRPFLCLLLPTAAVLLHVSVLRGAALSALLRAHTHLHRAALLLLPWRILLTGRVSLGTRSQGSG